MTKFWSKVQVLGPHDCWKWQAATHRTGYGWFHRPGTARASIFAHRMAWELTRGPIPPGGCVLHHCDNPPCCNPAHLFLGNRSDNAADKTIKGRTPHGEGHVRAKLTESDVLNILKLYPKVSQTTLAREYKVTTGTIRQIIKRKIWKHVTHGGNQSDLPVVPHL